MTATIRPCRVLKEGQEETVESILGYILAEVCDVLSGEVEVDDSPFASRRDAKRFKAPCENRDVRKVLDLLAIAEKDGWCASMRVSLENAVKSQKNWAMDMWRSKGPRPTAEDLAARVIIDYGGERSLFRIEEDPGAVLRKLHRICRSSATRKLDDWEGNADAAVEMDNPTLWRLFELRTSGMKDVPTAVHADIATQESVPCITIESLQARLADAMARAGKPLKN